MGKKALVAHFSASGVTADVAGRLAKAIKISGKKNEIFLKCFTLELEISDWRTILSIHEFGKKLNV